MSARDPHTPESTVPAAVRQSVQRGDASRTPGHGMCALAGKQPSKRARWVGLGGCVHPQAAGQGAAHAWLRFPPVGHTWESTDACFCHTDVPLSLPLSRHVLRQARIKKTKCATFVLKSISVLSFPNRQPLYKILKHRNTRCQREVARRGHSGNLPGHGRRLHLEAERRTSTAAFANRWSVRPARLATAGL